MENALVIVESFFGHELDDSVLETARVLPMDQLTELASCLRGSDLGQPRALPARSPGVLGPHVHEGPLLRAGRNCDLAELPELKHLILYCDELVIANPLVNFYVTGGTSSRNGVIYDFHVTDEVAWAARLAEALRQLLPVAELVRNGTFLLEDVRYGAVSANQIWFYMGDEIPNFRLDPYIQWFVNTQTQDRGAAISSEHPSDQAMRDLLQTYPAGTTMADVGDAVRFAEVLENRDWRPITSHPAVAHHQRRSAQLGLGSTIAAPDPTPTVAYRIPELSQTSMAEVIRLRRNEEIFAEVRETLKALESAYAQSVTGDTYDEYRRTVHAYADDIVRPAYERLERLTRRSRWMQRLAQAGAGALTFGLEPAIGSVPFIGDVLGGQVERALGGRAKRREADAHTAGTILKTLLRY